MSTNEEVKQESGGPSIATAEAVKEPSVEVSGATGLVGMISFITIYSYIFYVWGVNHDFLSWGFLFYLFTMGILLYIPSTIIKKLALADRKITSSEVIIELIITIALVYFVSPYAINVVTSGV